MPFDPLVINLPAVLDGNISLPNVIDPLTEQPTRIIQTTQAWAIQVSWDIKGFASPGLGGDWHVKAYLEARDGGSDPGQVGLTQNVALSAAPPPAPPNTQRNYSATVHVAAGAVRAGLFTLTVAVTYSNSGVTLPMAAFSDGPILQFIVP